MENYFKLIAERYSVRSFSPQTVEAEKLAQILEAGRLAPTSCNNQPQRIKVIADADGLEKVDECMPYRFNSSTVLLICYDKTVCWKSPFNGGYSGEVDASIVITHMMLATHALGLGACWVMYFDPAEAAALFELPENITPVAMLPIGYSSEKAAPSKRHYSRVPIEKILL